MKNKLIISSFLLLFSLGTVQGCNNPFFPSADLTVTEVKSTDTTKGVSVLQSFKKSGEFIVPQYKYNDPIVTIQNLPGLPRVVFKQMIIKFTVGDKDLPPIERAVTITVPSGGQVSATIPILSTSQSLRNTVFPNNFFVSAEISTGFAEVTLLGQDYNGHIIATTFSTPIRFETDPANATDPSLVIEQPNDGNNNTNNNTGG